MFRRLEVWMSGVFVPQLVEQKEKMPVGYRPQIVDDESLEDLLRKGY